MTGSVEQPTTSTVVDLVALQERLVRPTALVVGGGGRPGAAQVSGGMAREHGFLADLVVGTPAGPPNGAILAAHPGDAAPWLQHMWVPGILAASRWDHLKDTAGIPDAFVRGVVLDSLGSETNLLLAGSSVTGVSDDADGVCTHEETAVCRVLPSRARRRVGPVIAARIGGTRKPVHDDVAGRLVDATDLPGFAAAIVHLLGDTAAARRLGAATRQRIQDLCLLVPQLAQCLDLVLRLRAEAPSPEWGNVVTRRAAHSAGAEP